MISTFTLFNIQHETFMLWLAFFRLAFCSPCLPTCPHAFCVFNFLFSFHCRGHVSRKFFHEISFFILPPELFCNSSLLLRHSATSICSKCWNCCAKHLQWWCWLYLNIHFKPPIRRQTAESQTSIAAKHCIAEISVTNRGRLFIACCSAEKFQMFHSFQIHSDKWSFLQQICSFEVRQMMLEGTLYSYSTFSMNS